MKVASTARSDEWGGCSPAGLRLLLRFALGILAMSVLSDLVLPDEAERRARRDLGRGRRRGALLDRAHARRRLPPRLRADVVGLTVALLTVVVLVHVVVPRDGGNLSLLVLVLASSGVFVPVVRWVLAVDGICVVGLLVLASGPVDSAVLLDVAVTVVFALVTGHALFAVCGRSRQQVAALTAALEAQAWQDDLTGLLNRRGLSCALERLTAAGRVLTVLAMDIDGFKRVNDLLGHAAGDDVLVHVAQQVRALLPPGALLARTGGDEFVAVLEGEGDALAAELRRFVRAGGAAPWSLSVGVGCGPAEDASALPLLLTRADRDMYRDKQSRRRRAGEAPDLLCGTMPG